jgi:hypothetical protein
MTYGELKIETLRIMFASNGQDIHPDDLQIYEGDENYRFYLINIPGSVNRCLSRIEERRVLPDRARALRRKEGVVTGGFIRFDLSLIPDFFDLERIVKDDALGNYDGAAPYEREGNTVVLPLFEEGDGISYTVVYKPSIKRVRSFTENDEKIDLPEGIASIVPYYLKGDLFREDEPDEANEARLWFEQALDEIQPRRGNVVGGVRSVYSQEEW